MCRVYRDGAQQPAPLSLSRFTHVLDGGRDELSPAAAAARNRIGDCLIEPVVVAAIIEIEIAVRRYRVYNYCAFRARINLRAAVARQFRFRYAIIATRLSM